MRKHANYEKKNVLGHSIESSNTKYLIILIPFTLYGEYS